MQDLGSGPSLMSENGREWNMNHLLFADDTAQMANSQNRLRQLVEEFGRMSGKKKREFESK